MASPINYSTNGGAQETGSTPTVGGNLNQFLSTIVAKTQPLTTGTPQEQINMAQPPKWLQNIKPKESLASTIYEHTGGLGNCMIPHSFGGIRINLPGWHYANADDEWGSSTGTSSGTGVLTAEHFAGSTLYRDLATGNYFYVVRHGHHNPKTGLESKARLKKYPRSSIPNRLYEDAVIGSDDKIESKKGTPEYLAGRPNTAIVGVPDPNMTKINYMNIVYPSYDVPDSGPMLLNNNSNKSTLLNERIDDTKYTPAQDFSSLVSAAKLPKSQASAVNKEFEQQQKQIKDVLGQDIEPVDPNFHIFRPVNMDAIRTHPDMAAAEVIGLSGAKYGHLQAWKLIKAYVALGGAVSCGYGKGMPASTYYQILKSTSPHAQFPSNVPDYVGLSIATGKSSFASTPMTKLENLSPYQNNLSDYMYARQYYYESLLFDYYADNSKFFSGQFDVTGRTGIEYGVRFEWYDVRRHYVWEGYIDGVEHHFYYNSGQPWTTTINVERALPFTPQEARSDYIDTATNHRVINENMYGDTRPTKFIKGNFSRRFSGGFWGRQAKFFGGFFGEQTLQSMMDQANMREKAYMSHFVNGGNGGSSKSKAAPKSTGSSSIVSYAKSQIGKHTYGYESTRNEIASNPKSGNADCSSFVWSVLKHCGYKVSSSPWNTRSALDSYMHKISSSSVKAGDVGVENQGEGHMIISEGPYHGASTKIIDEGGDGNNVNESSLHDCATAVSPSGWTWYQPEKK